jgi:hypothetical protein
MKATAIGFIACMIIIALSATCYAGHSQGFTSEGKLVETLKIALHLAPHATKQNCTNPVITTRDDLIRQGTAGGSYDVFVILFDYGPGVTGLEYGLNWPAEWGSAATTHCADFAIGDIVDPIDVEPFEGPWVATEPTTWGGIKAMFR